MHLKRLIFFFVPVFISGAMFSQVDDFIMQRKDMVNRQIKARGIKHQATLDALEKVPRHLFIPDQLWDKAYRDGPLPIGHGQTISQPYIVAYMTAMLEPKRTDKILEIGTGSGYQAAVLSEIADSIFTIEIVDELAIQVDKKLKQLGYKNIYVKSGDGYFGWAEHAPFDKIIVTAAAEEVPPILIEQLNEGGKMIIPVGPQFGAQYLMLIEKRDGEIIKRNKLPVRFVPFTRDDEE